MQYRLPLPSGRLWPKWIPSSVTVSPFRKLRTLSQTTSSSRNEGQPWSVDSRINSCFSGSDAICSLINTYVRFRPVGHFWLINCNLNQSPFLPRASLWRNKERLAPDRIVEGDRTVVLLVHELRRGEVARVLGKVSIKAANLIRRWPIDTPAQVLHQGLGTGSMFFLAHNTLIAVNRIFWRDRTDATRASTGPATWHSFTMVNFSSFYVNLPVIPIEAKTRCKNRIVQWSSILRKPKVTNTDCWLAENLTIELFWKNYRYRKDTCYALTSSQIMWFMILLTFGVSGMIRQVVWV